MRIPYRLLNPDRNSWLSALGILMVLLPAAVLAHGSAIRGVYIEMEDFARMFSGSAGQEWHSWTQLFSPDYFSTFHAAFYRPAVSLFYYFEWLACGANIEACQWLKLSLLFGISVLIFRIGQRLLGATLWALAAALLYVVHPLHTGPMLGLSKVEDLLMAFFFLLAFFCYLRFLENKERSLWLASLVAAFYSLALLSRESAVVFPAVLLLHDWAFQESPAAFFQRKSFFRIYLPALVITGLYFCALAWVGGARYSRIAFPVAEPFWKPGIRLLWLIAKAFFPLEEPVPGIGKIVVAGSLLAIMLVWEGMGSGVRRAFFYGSWIILGLLPVVNMLSPGMPSGYVPVGPSLWYLVLPGAVFCWLAASTLRKCCAKRWSAAAAVLLIAGVVVSDIRACNMAAKAGGRLKWGDFRAGEFLREDYVFTRSGFESLMVSLPIIRRRDVGTYQEVERLIRSAFPGYQGPTIVSMFSSDAIFEDTETYSAVLEALDHKRLAGFHRELAEASRAYGPAEGMRIFAKRIWDAERLKDLGVTLSGRGDYVGSLDRLRESLDKNPDNIYTLLSAGAVMVKLGMFDDALKVYDKAVSVRPREPHLYSGLLGARTSALVAAGTANAGQVRRRH